MSKYIWYLHEQNKSFSVVWRIAKVIHGKIRSDFCKLCMTETYVILNTLGDEKLLNKRSEFTSKC